MPTNSSSTTAKRYREDVPNMIQEKIDLLCDQERHIATLEAQLDKLRSQRERLEKELEPYRIHTHSALAQAVAVTLTQDTRCPIHRLPNELLHLIFEFVVHGSFEFGCESHRLNLGTILQICRRWYNLIMHSPSLWARIEIPDAMLFIDIRGQKPIIQYIEACLLRSQGLPLDMELEFDELNASNYMKAELYAYAKTLVDEDEYDSIISQIYGQEWEFHSSIFLVKLHQIFNSLFGENGQHLRRWRALTILLPLEEEFADLVWLRMAPTMGNLTSIEILNAPSSWSNGRVWAEADLSNINSLRIHGSHTKDNFTVHLPNVSLTTLTSLDIGVGASVTNLEGLSSLQHLHSLKLSCHGLPLRTKENGAAPLFSLHLPRLNKLTIMGNYIHLRKISFKLPALQILSIFVENPRQRLPALSPSSIEWRLGYVIGNEIDPATLVPLIRDVLLLSRQTRRITIPVAKKAVFLKQIRQCRLEGAKISLSENVVEADDRGPEIIDVMNLV